MTTIKTVKQSDIRRTQVLARAASGATTRAIARELGMSEPAISRILALRESQEILGEVIHDLSDQIQTRLPVLLTKALDELERALESKFTEPMYRLKAAETVLRTATRLSELAAKSHKPNL